MMSSFSRKLGWAVGYMGGIFHTNDGGKNWTEQRGYILGIFA